MITVAADSEWTTRTIEPYALDVTRTGDHLVRALDGRSGEPRSCRLDRIEALNVMPCRAFLLDHTPLGERGALDRIPPLPTRTLRFYLDPPEPDWIGLRAACDMPPGTMPAALDDLWINKFPARLAPAP